MEIINLNQFRGKMKRTTVTENGKVTISIGPEKYTGIISHSSLYGYYIEIENHGNDKPFNLAGVDKVSFMESVLGYTDKDGDWLWMKSTDDILKVLVELDKLYIKEPGMAEPESMETERPSIEDIDFTPKKRHYSFNFQM